MHTAIIILGGIVIWAAGLMLARRFGKPGGTAIADTTLAFITAWLLATLTSLWIGAARGGYTLRDGIPGFIVIFAIPAAVAAIVKKTFF